MDYDKLLELFDSLAFSQDLSLAQCASRIKSYNQILTELSKKEAHTDREAEILSKLIGENGWATQAKNRIKSLESIDAARRAALETSQEINQYLQPPTNPAGSTTKSGSGGTSIELVESADDKLYQTGGFKSLGHLSYDLIHFPERKRESVKSITGWVALSTRVITHNNPNEEEKREAIKAYEAIKATDGMSVNDALMDILVPPQFSQQIFRRRARSGQDLASKCYQIPIKNTSIQLPAFNDFSDKETDFAGGVQAFWESEGSDLLLSKPSNPRIISFRPKRLTVGVKLSDDAREEGAGFLDSFIEEGASRAFVFKINYNLFWGNGVGKPHGALNSNAKIKIAREASQLKTIVAQNIEKMYQAFPAEYLDGAAWYVNQDCLSQLTFLTMPTGSSSGQALFVGANGFVDAPYGRIKGLPIIPVPYAQTLGTEGDITLINWSQIGFCQRGETASSISMHVRFLQSEQVMKFVAKIDAQSMWDQPIEPLHGTNKTSIIVTLETRPAS